MKVFKRKTTLPTKTLSDKEKLDCEVMNCSSPPRGSVDGIFALHSGYILKMSKCIV